jgi:hypothetical protein
VSICANQNARVVGFDAFDDDISGFFGRGLSNFIEKFNSLRFVFFGRIFGF